MNKNKNLLFVYGSLKKGFYNHRLLETSKFLGEFTTEPKYNLYSFGAYPAMTLNGSTPIKGEVYEVTDEVLKQVDRLEGYRGNNSNFYDRNTMETPFGTAYFYTINSNHSRVNELNKVKSGIWKI